MAKVARASAKQNKNLYGAYQWTYSAVNAVWEKKAYDNAEVVVAASSTVRKELKELGVAPAKLRVILNGADLAEFYPGQVDRVELKLPENVPLGLFAGDLRTPRKNLDTVLKAIAQTENVHLSVVGKTDGSPFPAMAQQLGIAERVHFLGFRRDIAQIMRACDLFIFPSRYEACALVLAESIASGLPVVTAQTTGGSELIEPGWGVCVPDPNDATALASAIISSRRQARKSAAIWGARHGIERSETAGTTCANRIWICITRSRQSPCLLFPFLRARRKRPFLRLPLSPLRRAGNCKTTV